MVASIGHPRYTIIGIVCVGIVLFIIGFLIGFYSAPDKTKSDDASKAIAGKRKAEAKEKLEYHKKLFDSLDAGNIDKNLQYFSKHPHVGGTPRSKELADEIAKRWTDYGFDKVETPKYNVYLPYVNPNVSNSVKILYQNGTPLQEFTGKEQTADPSENDPDMIAPLLGYAKPGTATGTLLYVNYGTQDDFKKLTNLGISGCNGKIVIMRYGQIFRGSKVKHAQECGAAGVILYNDPQDSAPEGPDKVYPNYIYLPKTGVQRGSIFTRNGDPLTPTVPSIEGVSRIPEDEANLPKIPATPMPYGDAVKLLERMRGQVVPKEWRGGLNINYTLGDDWMADNVTIKITVNVPNKRQDIYNVIGTIYGKEEPDRWVLIGNHRDAWGFGAVDASSGTASMMEISRAMKELLASGWRPRRTIKFCSWGAEESGLIGSTEWVEENERYLSAKAVAYINVDISMYGNKTLDLSGSPLLQTTVFENIKKVEDPHKKDGRKMTVYERMSEVTPDKSKPAYGRLGAGSDYAAFYQFIGVPCVDMSYADDQLYHVYHTVHDTYKWVQLVDPTFVYHLTTTRVASRLLMEFAETVVLPFKATTFATVLNSSLDILKQNAGKTLADNKVNLTYLENAVNEFIAQAKVYTQEQSTNHESKSDLIIRELNDRVTNVEKSFIYSGGLPDRPTVRHLLFAPSASNSYGTTSFPGITDQLSTDNKTDWPEVKKQVSLAFIAVKQATKALKADAKDN